LIISFLVHRWSLEIDLQPSLTRSLSVMIRRKRGFRNPLPPNFPFPPGKVLLFPIEESPCRIFPLIRLSPSPTPFEARPPTLLELGWFFPLFALLESKIRVLFNFHPFVFVKGLSTMGQITRCASPSSRKRALFSGQQGSPPPPSQRVSECRTATIVFLESRVLPPPPHW